MVTAVRLGALALGFSCAGLGAFGAYEFAHRFEGEVTYLVLAAPLIAVAAALIPPIAEASWRSGHPLKALLWWLTLVPAGAVVFFSAAERVHVAKAGAQAGRSALRSAASLAQAALTKRRGTRPVRGTRRKAKRSQPRAPKPVDARAKAEAYFRRGASNDNVVRLPAA